MFVSCECCVLSGRGLCDGPIPRPEKSYRLCCVSECDQVNIHNVDTYCEQAGRRGKYYETKPMSRCILTRSPYLFYLLVHSRCRGFLFSLDHTQTHTTVGRTPLDEGSARRKMST
jgi:hypothetical protein